MSPDGKYLSFCIVSGERERLYVLDVSKDSSKALPLNIEPLAYTWYPSKPANLFVVGNDYNASKVAVSDSQISIVSSWSTPRNMILTFPSWSPDGTVLATRLSLFKENSLPGVYLGLSFDGGKSFVATSIQGGYVHWSDNRELYICNKKGIQRVELVEQNARVKEDIGSHAGEHGRANLIDSYNKKALYILDKKIYLGDKILYTSIEHLSGCAENGLYISAIDNNYLIVLDEEGKIIAKHSIRQGSEIMGMSSDNRIYLGRDRRIIERWDFLKGQEPIVIYEVK